MRVEVQNCLVKSFDEFLYGKQWLGVVDFYLNIYTFAFENEIASFEHVIVYSSIFVFIYEGTCFRYMF